MSQDITCFKSKVYSSQQLSEAVLLLLALIYGLHWGPEMLTYLPKHTKLELCVGTDMWWNPGGLAPGCMFLNTMPDCPRKTEN